MGQAQQGQELNDGVSTFAHQSRHRIAHGMALSLGTSPRVVAVLMAPALEIRVKSHGGWGQSWNGLAARGVRVRVTGSLHWRPCLERMPGPT